MVKPFPRYTLHVSTKIQLEEATRFKINNLLRILGVEGLIANTTIAGNKSTNMAACERIKFTSAYMRIASKFTSFYM